MNNILKRIKQFVNRFLKVFCSIKVPTSQIIIFSLSMIIAFLPNFSISVTSG